MIHRYYQGDFLSESSIIKFSRERDLFVRERESNFAFVNKIFFDLRYSLTREYATVCRLKKGNKLRTEIIVYTVFKLDLILHS